MATAAVGVGALRDAGPDAFARRCPHLFIGSGMRQPEGAHISGCAAETLACESPWADGCQAECARTNAAWFDHCLCIQSDSDHCDVALSERYYNSMSDRLTRCVEELRETDPTLDPSASPEPSE